MKIGFLHTAQVHVATFDAILDGSGVQAIHHVDADLLTRAQSTGADTVRHDTIAAIDSLDDADAIVCTCSTLGPLIDQMKADTVLRIDKPAFAQAVALGPRNLLVICLESTRTSSEGLLADCAAQAGVPNSSDTLLCAAAWAHFEASNLDAFYTAIADEIRVACSVDTYDAVILAQASMAGTALLLADLGLPVLATPQMAVQAAIKAAKARA